MKYNYKNVPEEIEKPGEVILFEKGWDVHEISEATGKTKTEVNNIMQRYWLKRSKSLVNAIAERNVVVILGVLNIKKSLYL